MKRIAVALLLMHPVAASAQEMGCQEMSEMAAKIMEARQAGVGMSRMIEITGEQDIPQPDKEYMQGVILLAYKENAWRSESAQKRAITEFSNKAMISCIEGDQG